MADSDVERAERAYAQARLAYTNAELALEDSYVSGDEATRDAARRAFGAAGAAAAGAGAALAVAQGAAPVSFESLLLDPTSQLDAGAAVLRSILQYASAPKATAGPPPVEHRHSWPDEHVFSGGAPSFRFGFDAASGSPQRVSA